MKNKKKFLKYFFSLIIVFSLASLNYCLASGMVPVPTGPASASCSSPNCGNYQLSDFVEIFILVAEFILSISGSLALLAFVIGGVMMILSGGNKERVQSGQKILVAAVVGLAIVFSSFLIIKFVLGALGIKWTGGFYTIP